MIDCQTGIVLHKYKVPGEVSASAWLLRGGGRALAPGGRSVEVEGPDSAACSADGPCLWCWTAVPRWLCPSVTAPLPAQEFFSVAWTALTVVTQTGHKKRWNVLAAAGLRGLVRLLHVQAGFCCGLIRGHRKAIATLCFSPTHETHLFSKTFLPHPPGLPQYPCPAAWHLRAPPQGGPHTSCQGQLRLW